MSTESSVGLLIGGAMLLLGMALLLNERWAYWYFDRTLKWFMAADDRMPWHSKAGGTYEDWRPLLRWIVPSSFVIVGGILLGVVLSSE
jgi:hypothetical protein